MKNSMSDNGKEKKPKELFVSLEGQKTLWEEVSKLPRLTLTERQLCDLELLLNGGFAPLEGFMNKDDYESVVERSRLASGDVWPMPVVLDVANHSIYKKGDRIVLCDMFSKPLAVMDIESVYTPDKKREAESVYGTCDTDHFGVHVLFEKTKDTYVGGKVYGIELPSKYDFIELRHTPMQLREMFRQKGWDTVVGFQTRNPMHRVHFEIVKQAAKETGGKVLIHPVVGLTKDGDIDYPTRVRSYKHVHETHGKDFTAMSLLPLAMRMAGPREALWHALVRKNYGCTHFIVGRDHAGPGKDAQGRPFYGAYDAQDMLRSFEEEIGIKMLAPKEMVYVEETGQYLPREDVQTKHTIKSISGTQVREMLRKGDDIPEWFSFPEVVSELRNTVGRQKGFAVFLTGLSASGKSTIAQLLKARLHEIQKRDVTMLDGDVIRQYLSKGLGFSKEDRNTNVERIGFVASEVVRHGGIAICAAIAPYETSRQHNRKLIDQVGAYVEVHVATPLKECQKRDPKGLYAKAKKGLIKNFTGIDDPYEEPKDSELTIDTTNTTPAQCVEKIIGYLKEKGLL